MSFAKSMNPPAGFDAVLTRTETAAALRVSLPTVDRLIKAGRLSVSRVNRTILVDPDSVRALLPKRA